MELEVRVKETSKNLCFIWKRAISRLRGDYVPVTQTRGYKGEEAGEEEYRPNTAAAAAPDSCLLPGPRAGLKRRLNEGSRRFHNHGEGPN